MAVTTGPRNLITDVAGILVGNAEDQDVLSGVTVVLPDGGAVAGIENRGGAPGTRETDVADPSCLVENVHGIVLAGGSVFGLAAADAVTSCLAARGIGFSFREQPHVCPVVQAANLFDLTNGGNKNWGDTPPYHALGRAACDAAGEDFALGNTGAGLGALAGTFKGGLGSASALWEGYTVGAVVAVNPFGSPANPSSLRLWSADYEIDGEFGGDLRHSPGLAGLIDPSAETKASRIKQAAGQGQNTTIAVVATDAELTPAQCRRLAIMAADGMSRAIRPIHTPFDGDVVFTLATGAAGKSADPLALSLLGTVAADSLCRAIGRAVWEADSIGGWSSYRERIRV